MKKRIAWLLAAALLLIPVLCACDGADAVTTDYIYFKNDTGYKAPGFYPSTAEEEEWGEKLNWGEFVGVGGRIHINVEKLVNGAGQYDVGAIDERGLNYEVYDVDLAPGDVISLRAEDAPPSASSRTSRAARTPTTATLTTKRTTSTGEPCPPGVSDHRGSRRFFMLFPRSC